MLVDQSVKNCGQRDRFAFALHDPGRRSHMNVDLETRDQSHIKMGERKIHISIILDAPTGRIDHATASMVMVDSSELQRPINRPPETNPVPKVNGAVLVTLWPEAGAGFGRLLIDLD